MRYAAPCSAHKNFQVYDRTTRRTVPCNSENSRSLMPGYKHNIFIVPDRGQRRSRPLQERCFRHGRNDDAQGAPRVPGPHAGSGGARSGSRPPHSGEFDADLMGLALGSPEVEAYVADLREVEQRLAEAPPEATQDRIDRIERELRALRRRFVDGAATSRYGPARDVRRL